jgi:hypothetical protein
MSVIVNEVEIVAPTSTASLPSAALPPLAEPMPSAHDLYWAKRKLMERCTRLAAR